MERKQWTRRFMSILKFHSTWCVINPPEVTTTILLSIEQLNNIHTYLLTFNTQREFVIVLQVSALQIIVGSILLGAIVLIVGLVQLVPNAADADHRYIFLGCGGVLLVLGIVMTVIRCVCIHCQAARVIIDDDQQPELDGVNSIDVLVQRRDTQVSTRTYLTASGREFKKIRVIPFVTTTNHQGSSSIILYTGWLRAQAFLPS